MLFNNKKIISYQSIEVQHFTCEVQICSLSYSDEVNFMACIYFVKGKNSSVCVWMLSHC